MNLTRAQVVVVGAGITGLACAHRLISLGLDAILLESSDRVGGKIRTVRQGGVEFETGPSTLILNKQPMLDLVREVGLEPDIIDATPAAKNRWITKDGRLCPLPHSPMAALTSPLTGPLALARALGDVFIRSTQPRPTESVASFIRRHFGPRILDNLVAPFLSGIYAGDPERLEAAAVLPMLANAERLRGSVILGMMARRRIDRESGTRRLPMRSVTFRGGLESLPLRIADHLGPHIRLNTTVRSITETRSGQGRVELNSGEAIECDRIILATSSRAAATLIAHLPEAQPIHAALQSCTAASLAVVGLLYPRSAIPHPLNGFGYINGPGSTSPILGCLFRSSVFPHAAPASTALLLCFVGGARHPEAAALTGGQLVALVQREISDRLGATGDPRSIFLQRWPDGIPQYNIGHSAIRQAVEHWCSSRPVSIIGSALTGVSLNDCAAAGRAEADRLAATLGPTRHAHEEVACQSA